MIRKLRTRTTGYNSRAGAGYTSNNSQFSIKELAAMSYPLNLRLQRLIKKQKIKKNIHPLSIKSFRRLYTEGVFF